MRFVSTAQKQLKADPFGDAIANTSQKEPTYLAESRQSSASLEVLLDLLRFMSKRALHLQVKAPVALIDCPVRAVKRPPPAVESTPQLHIE
mmetsp:Transcript_4389/g.12016  ORF Transcript_4389/g.12016 Transcript_4389/m.12016 type:complete len:91 (+) Transcript_4389:2534-2806(+)